jgi:carbonic anhydrase
LQLIVFGKFEAENAVCYSLKASVVEDMKILKDSPYLRKNLKVYGYVYDIKTGKLQEVKE